MKLATFNIIVTVDRNYHIINDGCTRFYRDKTARISFIKNERNMLSPPKKVAWIIDKTTLTITLEKKHRIPDKIIVLDHGLTLLSALKSDYLDGYSIYILGEESLYREALSDFGYLCKNALVYKVKAKRDTGGIFPRRLIKHFPQPVPEKGIGITLCTFKLDVRHQEHKYLSLMKKIMKKGEVRKDRTGVGTKSLFGVKMKFDLSKQFPLFTTKRVPRLMVFKELLFFISGETDTKILEKQKVNIWKGNTSKEFLVKRGLQYEEGDYGPSYGFQWRHFGAKYEGCNKDYTGKGVDQLTKLIDQIKNNPYSRRHILTAWNPSQLDEMPLPPCHAWCQFYVSEDKHLDCQLYQRSGDMFLGVPFNVASYSALTYIMAHLTGLKPGKLIHIIGDAHIYLNHQKQVEEQLSRTPMPFPKLKIVGRDTIKTIDDFKLNNLKIEGYNSWPSIKAKMAV